MASRPPQTRSRGSANDRRLPDGSRDYVGTAVAYAEEAAADRRGKKFGKWIRLAARRFLADLKRARGRRPAFLFDDWRAGDVCKFVEALPHVEGVWDTPNIVLHESHVFFLVNLFGFRKLDGTRRFTTALWAVARKNAKSTMAAAITLYCLLCEGEVGPQVITAATTGAQARIVFNVAKRMVEKTVALQEAFGVAPWANSIACLPIGGTFKPINAKASTQDGLNPSCVSLDELHAHKTHDLLNVLKSAAGARRNPLFLFTTTEGYETPGPWPEQRKFAQQVLEGTVEADHYLAVIYALDEGDDEFNAATWIKANPLIEVNPVLAREIAKESVEAKSMPGRLAEFRIKRCNRQAASATGWVNLVKWNRCSAPPDLDRLRRERLPCWGGLDLASTSDLCAFVLVWRIDGVWHVWARFWTPADQVEQRSTRGTVNYAGWVEAGHIVQTEGDVTDYRVIEAAVVEAHETLNLQTVAFDSWNAQDLCNRLTETGVPMAAFVQGTKSYHPAMQEVQHSYISGRVAHGGHPVLTWNAANLVASRDNNNNEAPSKKRSAEKIDGMCALFMAVGAAIANDGNGKSFWES